MFVGNSGGFEVALELAFVDLLEEIFEEPVVALEDRVLRREIHRIAAVQAIARRGAREVADRVVEVVHRHRDAAAREVVYVELNPLAAVLGGEGKGQLALARNHQVGRAVLVAKGVAADHDRLGPAGYQARHVGDHDRLTEDDAAEDVANRPVGRAVHLLQRELLHARLVGRDRRALDADAVLFDRVRGVDCDLIVGRVAVLDAQVVVLQVDVEVGQDQLLLDERPDDPCHLVAVELDDGVLHLDLGHGWGPWRSRSGRRGERCYRGCYRRRVLLFVMATFAKTAAGEDGAPWRTHEVLNQVPALEGWNVFSTNTPLVEALQREGGSWAGARAAALGELIGGEPQEWGVLANEHKPVLRTHDRFGNRLDEVEFHPAWHKLMQLGVEWELHSLPWRSQEPAAHAARAALYMTAMQAEAGFACPITMTFAAIPALRAQPELAAEWEPLLTANTYDPRSIPAAEKGSAISGMAMTEKQGGSDVRANTTIASPLNGGGPGAEYEVVGHKWFCSAPQSDMFLVLAQTEEGLSCFLMPRILPDGSHNAMHVQRLKDKLGNRSNASSEIELHGAWGRMVGEPGRGVPTIIEMVGHTRLDCRIGISPGMRVCERG